MILLPYPALIQIFNLPRQQKLKGLQLQVVRIANILSLTKNVLFLKDKKSTKKFSYSKYPNTTPSLLKALQYIEKFNDYYSDGLHLIYIEDLLNCEKYTVIQKFGYGLSSII